MDDIKVRLLKDGPFPVNESLAGIVPMACPSEQAVLTADIKANGQVEPIVLWKGEVVDGRCRQTSLVILGKHIMYKELDSNLTEDEVKIFVKAVNTRRNLTAPQKVAIACKQYVANKHNTTILDTAKAWGIGEVTLKNALWIYKEDPAVIETIFNGGTVTIGDKSGKAITSNKITAVYAYMKKLKENVVEVDRGWQVDTNIKSQAGKEWYYEQMKHIGEVAPYVRVLIAELANLKFALPAVI